MTGATRPDEEFAPWRTGHTIPDSPERSARWRFGSGDV